jgi:HK97 family phage major capsid protein
MEPDLEALQQAEQAVETAAKDVEGAQKVLADKQERFAKAFQLAGADLDFSNSDVLSHLGASDSAGAVAVLQKWNDELSLLGMRADSAMARKRLAESSLKKLTESAEPTDKAPANPPPLPGGNGDQADSKSLGELIVKTKSFEKFRLSRGQAEKGAAIIKGYGIRQLKTLFQTSDGWPPESTRVPGLVIPAVTRPIQVLDLIPIGPTSQAAVVYLYESTLTHASAERNEGAAYAESEFDLTETSSTVRSIGSSIPVTDEQLEDVDGVQSYLEQRLTFGNRQRLDYQVLNGDGVAPNLTGVLNNGDLQTQAKGADPVPDAVYKAMTLVRVTGRAFPNAFIAHPNDWQDVRLLRTADGIYIWGSPSEAGPERIWGLQVAQSDAITENTGLIGDFANFCKLYERRGMEVMMGWDSDDFTKGIRTIRAGFRVAFVVYRGAAFCSVTGI